MNHHYMQKNRMRKGGATTLPAVILLAAVSLVVAVSITTMAFTESFVSQSSAQSSRALLYAESGARDALIKIARNKNFACSTTDCYSMDFSANGCALNEDCVKISVSAGTGAAGVPKVITSKGIMRSSTRTIQVLVTLDNGGASDGVITNAVWSEVVN